MKMLPATAVLFLASLGAASFAQPSLEPPLVNPEPVPSNSGALQLKTSLLHSEMAANEAGSMIGMATITAPATVASEKQRPGIDLVIVVDKSGSMRGEKMALLKRTLDFVISQLSSNDRLSIASFNGESELLFGLTNVTEDARKTLKSAVNEIVADGGTNIRSGLNKAFGVVKTRGASTSCSILLLTDGRHNVDTPPQPLEIKEQIPHECTLSTFGYGSDVDSQLCSNLAEAGNGMYSFIENNDGVGPAFALVLGGLTSISAEQITLSIEPAQPGLTIESMGSTFAHSTTATGGLTVQISNLFSGEHRDIVVRFSGIPMASPGSVQTLATATVAYSKPGSPKETLPTVPFVLLRPEHVLSNVVDVEVESQHARVTTVEHLKKAKELAEEGNFEAASELIAEQKKILLKSSQTSVVDSLLGDLEETMNVINPSDWRGKGVNVLLSHVSYHGNQRSFSSSSPDSASRDIYVTEKQAKMLESYVSKMKEDDRKKDEL